MKPNILLSLLLSSFSGPVRATWFHWRHHEDYMIAHFIAHGPFERDAHHSVPEGYEASCEATVTFKAKQYTKADIQPGGDLARWAPALESFLGGREYPGHWRGEEEHNAQTRKYLVMEYKDVPKLVRRWVDDHGAKGSHRHQKWMFAVLEKPKGKDVVSTTVEARSEATEGASAEPAGFVKEVPDKDKILFFAAGAMYEMLPLWAAEKSKCESTFSDLTRYNPYTTDGGVIAWATKHSSPDEKRGRKDVEFTIKAQLLTLPAEMRARQQQYDKMLRRASREARKADKERRGKDEL